MSTDSLRERFLNDGFVYLPQALDPSALNEALACWRWSMANPGPASARLYHDNLVRVADEAAGRALESSEPGFFYQDISNPEAFAVYENLLRSTTMTTLLRQFVETDAAWFLGEQVFLKAPSTPATGWHQDISDITAIGDDLIVFWIPFDPVDKETSLGLVKNSHRGPIYSSIYGQYRADAIPEVSKFETFACEPGDVVAFHMGCLHGGGPTRENQTRRALALRFAGENVRFSSRAGADDRRNGQPYRHSRMKQVLPA